MKVYYDFSHTTIAQLLGYLKDLAHDGLPTDSPHAQRLKRELAERGVPLSITDSLIEMARAVQETGATVTFGEEPGQVVAAVVIVIGE